MYLVIIILPLLGSIASGFFGRKIGVNGAQLITCIHIYSIGYMSHDPHNQRFFSYLSLFTFMMIILVTANNFLLIIAANQSSLSAFLTNRVGDCFLTIAPYINENVVTIIGICLLIGAMAKSSQVGLHVWLPMAMEGPTPVSALIHAATMVTAGVYLLMRTSPLIEYSSTVLISLIGLFQQDIKKVIAYSTMSQLGMMVIAVGLSCYNIALFHLINHAFYKADNQDFRKYGGLRPFLPLTYSVMLIASLSLVAFPFMTGFYSKDFILESAYGQYYYSSTVVYMIATIGAMFTTLYSVKVLYLTFLTNPNGPLVNYKQAHEVFSIFFGYITKDIFIGLGSGFFADNALFIHPSHEIMLDTEFGFTILLSVISIILSENVSELFYNNYITNFILKLGGQTTKVIDKGSVELLGPFGLEKNTGVITSYALYILIDNSILILILFSFLCIIKPE
ncbi:proton-translocating NADH-quinone o [Glonium stellatum]|uniref:Proton-translocating NADH-quinone o n=1 Tax=Glonium stellatum TaxID=574774 RepID=A0A8E2FAV1_9PEZI|nr:proton-translocating NADH-quinone o [Glonium stellatum]